LLPTGFGVKPEQFLPPFSTNTTIQLMCGTNLETSQVVLFVTVLSMLASVLAVEGDSVRGGNFDSRGLVVVTSYHNERRCIRLANKCTI